MSIYTSGTDHFCSVFLPGPGLKRLPKAHSSIKRTPFKVEAQKTHAGDLFLKSEAASISRTRGRSETAADKEPVAIYHGATDRARAALKSTRKVAVDAKWNGNRGIAFIPKHHPRKQGLVIYPGALVEHTAYAAIAHRIADQGYPVIIANTPFNVLWGNHDRASQAMEKFPNVKQWAVAGHSFGGQMVDFYAFQHPNKEKLKGMVYWGAIPALDQSRNTKLKMLLLEGANDNMVNKCSFFNYKKNMPSNSQFIEIPGANHSYFADYGLSFGDGKAEISRDEQQRQVSKLTARFLDTLAAIS